MSLNCSFFFMVIFLIKIYLLTGILLALFLNMMSSVLPEKDETRDTYERNVFLFTCYTMIFWLPIFVIMFIHLKDRK